MTKLGSLSQRSVRWLLASVFLLAACGPPRAGRESTERGPRPFDSALASLVVLDFDGELVAPVTQKPEKYIRDQLFYTVGQLNAHASVGRLDRVVLSAIAKEPNGDGRLRIHYHASLPVGWGAEGGPPASLELVLPRRITPAGLATFAQKYATSCVEASGHDVDAGNLWYHFRPGAEGCVMAPADVVVTTAAISPSPENTSGKYPEYDRIWDDGTLRVVAVFGKYEPYATDPNDPGIAAYGAFVSSLRAELGPSVTTTPATFPEPPGVSAPDITFVAEGGGRTVSVTALLIDAPKEKNAKFDARYAALTKDADLVAYAGHAGLGANVHALAEKGSFVAGKHQLFFFDGCDTFAYLDDRLAQRRAALNPDDPTGTLYMDVLTNLMPAYFDAMSSATLSVVRALLRRDDPVSYAQMFSAIDPQQVVVVTGEEDNAFAPAPVADWPGVVRKGALARGESMRFETPLLAAGDYAIRTREDPAHPGGDVDLYVGVGAAPTLDAFDAAPYLYGSDEDVVVTLPSPARIFVLAHGYEESPSPTSRFVLTAGK